MNHSNTTKFYRYPKTRNMRLESFILLFACVSKSSGRIHHNQRELSSSYRCFMDDFEETSFPVCSGNSNFEFCNGDNDCSTSHYCNCVAAREFCETRTNPCDKQDDFPSKIISQCDEDVCFLPLETGEGRADFVRYGFEPVTGRCEQFIWGGSPAGANDNRFASKTACEKRCMGCDGVDSPQKKDSHSSRVISRCDEDVCFLPLETGVGRAYFERYGFDPSTGACEQFVFGGGGDGNDNNFGSMTACNKRCQGCEDASW